MRSLCIASAAFYACFIWQSGARYAGELYFVLFDDAMISMRYARNLADGFGLVWNPGGAAVEGFTNPLWTLVMTLPHLFHLPDSKTSLVVMLLGAALLVANASVALLLTRRLRLRSTAAGMAAAASIAFLYPLVFWTLRGMEVGLLALCVYWGALLVADLAEGSNGRADRRRLRGLGCLLCVGMLTRPDFLVPGTLLVAGAALTAPRGKREGRLLLLLACLVGTLLALTAFRWLYYGDLLPNTYYLKIAGHGPIERIARGSDVLWDNFLYQLWPFALLVLLAVPHPDFRRPLPLLLLSIGLSQCLYSVYVGGDAWEGFKFANRFVTLGIPALLVVGALGIDVLAGWLHLRSLPARASNAAVLLLGLSLAWAPANLRDVGRWLESGAPNVESDHEMARLGLNIRDLTPEDTVIGVLWAGSIAYFARRKAVDMGGKTDRTVAHSAPLMPLGVPGHTKYVPSYSIEQLRPDLLVQVFVPDTETRRWLRSLGYKSVPRAVGRFAKAKLAMTLREEMMGSRKPLDVTAPSRRRRRPADPRAGGRRVRRSSRRRPSPRPRR